jgi:hypothetical protein
MSLLKVNEVQNYNGSSLTLTASTVSTSAQLNTGGNVSVTGSINVSDDSTTRSNLGLGSSDTASFASLTINGVTNQGFPSGTKMLFQQTAAPTGWTKDTGSNDVALRVVSGSVGSGGSVAFETAFASQTIPTHTLSSSEIPNFSTQFNIAAAGNSVSDPFSQLLVGTSNSGTANSGVGVISASWSRYNNGGIPGASVLFFPETGGGGGSHGHGSVDLDVNYVDVIIATKD